MFGVIILLTLLESLFQYHRLLCEKYSGEQYTEHLKYFRGLINPLRPKGVLRVSYNHNNVDIYSVIFLCFVYAVHYSATE